MRPRVFTMDEELAFAGHPVLGAAAVMHALLTDAEEEEEEEEEEFELTLAGRSRGCAAGATVAGSKSSWMKGRRGSGRRADPAERAAFAAALGLHAEDVHPSLPIEMATTGLP